MPSREPPADEETAHLLAALKVALPWTLYDDVCEAIGWRDTQIRVFKRVIQKLMTEENR